MLRRDKWFWVRISLTAVVVNVPIGVAMFLSGFPMLYAGVVSAAAGVATLVIWDGPRSRSENGVHKVAT